MTMQKRCQRPATILSTWMVAAGLLTFLGLAPPLTRDAQACGNQCEEICIDGCNSGYHYSWQQFVCVQNDNISGGRCDDGYACTFGSCGGAGERFCNTAGTGCNECFSGYYTDRGGINEYGSFNIDGVVYCAPSVRCQPGCQGAITVPNSDDITFYVTGEMEFGRSGSSSEPFHDRHVRILNTAGNGGTSWPSNASGGAQPLARPVAIVMAGDMSYTDQADSWTTTKCERLKELRLRYDHDRFRRRNPEKNILFPVLPGLGNHDLCKPGSCEGVSGGTWGDFDQNFIMTQYMDTLLLNSSGGRCMGVANYDGPETKQGASTSQDGWKSHNYSWDWGRYHLVQGNAWAGFLTGGDLSWLENDLRTNVGTSGKPVIYIQHFGWKGFSLEDRWWTAAEREKLFQILDQYNVVALIHGHNDPEHGSTYTVTHGSKTYTVFEIPQSGKDTTNGGDAGFLAVRLRPQAADFSFFHYTSSSDTLTPTSATTHTFSFPFACKGPTSTDWAITRGTGGPADGFRACQDDPAVPQGYTYASPTSSAEQQYLDLVSGGSTLLWRNTTNAQPPRFWNPGEPNGGRSENCVMMYGGGGWNDAGCDLYSMPYTCKGSGGAGDWRVTAQWGIHSDGTQACKAEFGASYRFSAPLSAAENSGLTTALAGRYAWINLTDEAVEGAWVPRPNHVMQRAAAYQRDDFSTTLYQAVNAVDGSLTTFTHTTSNGAPWIEIDLGGLKEIEPEGITVWNRLDCCRDRLANFWVVTSKTPFGPNDAAYPLSAQSPSAEYVYHYSGTPSIAAVIPMGTKDRPNYTWDRRARYVRIQLDRADFLSVAGIEVRGKSICPSDGCSSARLIAHYPMEEPTPRNQSPLLALLDVPVPESNTSQVAFGRIGGSHYFDGSSNYLDACGGGRFDSPSGTLMAWIHPQWTSGVPGYNPMILGIRNGAASTRLSVHVSSDYQRIGVWNGSAVNWFQVSGLAGNPIRPSNWSHVAVTYGGGNISLYVDGALVGTQAGGPGNVSGLELNIGWNGWGDATVTERFRGYIDEVRAFDGALTAGEIAAFAVGSW